jgi:hypothetical protein
MNRTASLDLSIDLDAALEGPRAADGTSLLLLLDPKTVRASLWVNRHQTSFEDANFEELKAEIQGAGGNMQPIKVRPLKEPAGEARYEIVFGHRRHRRHRACLELGLEVAAVVEEVGDQVVGADGAREPRQGQPLGLGAGNDVRAGAGVRAVSFDASAGACHRPQPG